MLTLLRVARWRSGCAMTGAIPRMREGGESTVGDAMTNVRAVPGEYVLKAHAVVDPEVPRSRGSTSMSGSEGEVVTGPPATPGRSS